ncbi:MAG TPA: hypothetical protein VGQ42_07895 [Candidatus Dormibacteraeota bacterium]|jgi:hypothetical protein|nr:hypothetical protein [Candidatus Dormibacteraeota bacterium]
MSSASTPRVLAIMGSGETSPTMTSVHSDLFAMLGSSVEAVMLDTPFGFQENASEIASRALAYFRENVQRPVSVASYRGAPWAGTGDVETMLARVRAARFVFAGPGSPSYALRQWSGTPLPSLLGDKLRDGGVIVFSSAAAATLGLLALPVYEVYKVGADPYWLDGLNLLATYGINVAVVPHYNNAEGGTHDTRYCYMGDRRLRLLESSLPDGAYVLGVDEHTACVIDVGAETLTVRGVGGVTLRRQGREDRIESGETVALDVVRAGTSSSSGEISLSPRVSAPAAGQPAPGTDAPVPVDPFTDGVSACRNAFDTAIAQADISAALSALLDLDTHLWDWSRETFSSDEMDRARALQRSLLVQLADVARLGARDPRAMVGPVVESVLTLRQTARADRRWADADALRDSLLGLGIELNDTPAGTDWQLPEGFGDDGASPISER